MADKLRVLIIGGVACGPKAASRLRRLDPHADITLIDRDHLVSYGACGLPYYVAGEFPNIHALTHTQVGLPRTPAFFEATKGFKVMTRTEALRIDRQKRTVLVRNLDSGQESELPYDRLVLATGGSAFKPPIDGLNLKNVWFMTHPDHARTLVEQIKDQGLSSAVLVGAGFINIEMAESLVNRGLSVTLVEMFDQILPGVLDADMAAYARIHLEDNEVGLVLGERVMALLGDGDGNVRAVKTDRQEISGDCVIVAVGTRPNDSLAREAGLHCDRGILINANCQTSDPFIYAGGDCAMNRFVRKTVAQNLYVPLGSTANKHGRVIANHIAGRQTPFSGINGTGVVRAFDYTIARTGLTENMARQMGMDYERIVWGGPDRPHYMHNARYMIIKMIASKKDRRVLGVQVVGAGDGAKRADVAATAIYFGATLEELGDVDLAYAPPFSPPIDPIATCAHVLGNKMDGLARCISVFEAKQRMDKGDVVLLDVREPDENKMLKMAYDPIIHIPLGQLRSRLSELPRDKDIIAFCKISLRGYEAQIILNQAGFDRVCFMEGGHEAWPFELDYLGM